MATKTTKTTKGATVPATVATPVNLEYNKVLERLQKASGWDIIGIAPNLAAVSTVGTTVQLNKQGQVEIFNLSHDLKKIVSKEADAKTIAKVIVEVNTEAIKIATTGIPVAAQSTEAKTTTKEQVTMATNKKDDKKATDKKAATVPATEEKKEKVIGKPIANPAGKGTPVFDALKKAATTDEQAREKIKGMWENFGATYEFKVGNLTKALLAEGLWPASKDKDGDFKAGDDGLQIPVGYQKVYKEEKEQNIKGIGHFVNVAAASFGRHNMEKAEKAEVSKKGPQGVESTPDEKQLAKILMNIEKLAIKVNAEDLKNYLESSKAFAPALAIIKEQEAALGAL